MLAFTVAVGTLCASISLFRPITNTKHFMNHKNLFSYKNHRIIIYPLVIKMMHMELFVRLHNHHFSAN